MIEPTKSSNAPRTRRTILTGAAAATVAGLLAGERADAAPGQPVLQGRVNNAGASNTTLNSTVSTSTLRVANTNGNGIAMVSTSRIGGTATTSNRNSFALSAGNAATSNGSGAAINATGNRNHGVIATTAAVVRNGLLARNTGTTSNVGSAIRAEGGMNDGVLGFASAADRGGLIGVDTTFETTNVGWGVVCVGDEYVLGTTFVDGDVDLIGTLFGGGDAEFVGTVTAANIPGGGTVTLDGAGTAVVNAEEAAPPGTEYNYQLTAIGSAMPNIHVVERADGSFSVAGGTPGGRVSWQRTKRLALPPTAVPHGARKSRPLSSRRIR